MSSFTCRKVYFNYGTQYHVVSDVCKPLGTNSRLDYNRNSSELFCGKNI